MRRRDAFSMIHKLNTNTKCWMEVIKRSKPKSCGFKCHVSRQCSFVFIISRVLFCGNSRRSNSEQWLLFECFGAFVATYHSNKVRISTVRKLVSFAPHSSAPAHCITVVHEFLAKNLKIPMKGTPYIRAIQEIVTRNLETITRTDFKFIHALVNHVQRYQCRMNILWIKWTIFI